jgi:hypothetical protein
MLRNAVIVFVSASVNVAVSVTRSGVARDWDASTISTFLGGKKWKCFVKQGIFNSDVGEISLNIKGQTRNINRKGKRPKHFFCFKKKRKKGKTEKDKYIETNTQYVQNVLISSLSKCMQSS